jgi:hypothetical protein
MDVAPGFFEQVIRFLMLLFGAFPSQAAIDPVACLEANYGRAVLETTIERGDALLPNSNYELTNVQFDTYNASVFYSDFASTLIGASTIARPCTSASRAWDDTFTDAWFEGVYPSYVLQKQRRCVYKNTTLVEYEALARADETPHILRYYYEPESDVRVNIVQYTFPTTEQDEMDEAIRLVYPQLVTCKMTP